MTDTATHCRWGLGLEHSFWRRKIWNQKAKEACQLHSWIYRRPHVLMPSYPNCFLPSLPLSAEITSVGHHSRINHRWPWNSGQALYQLNCVLRPQDTFKLETPLLHFILVCAPRRTGGGHRTAHLWEFLLSYHVGPRDQLRLLDLAAGTLWVPGGTFNH